MPGPSRHLAATSSHVYAARSARYGTPDARRRLKAARRPPGSCVWRRREEGWQRPSSQPVSILGESQTIDLHPRECSPAELAQAMAEVRRLRSRGRVLAVRVELEPELPLTCRWIRCAAPQSAPCDAWRGHIPTQNALEGEAEAEASTRQMESCSPDGEMLFALARNRWRHRRGDVRGRCTCPAARRKKADAAAGGEHQQSVRRWLPQGPGWRCRFGDGWHGHLHGGWPDRREVFAGGVVACAPHLAAAAGALAGRAAKAQPDAGTDGQIACGMAVNRSREAWCRAAIPTARRRLSNVVAPARSRAGVKTRSWSIPLVIDRHADRPIRSLAIYGTMDDIHAQPPRASRRGGLRFPAGTHVVLVPPDGG